MRARARISSRAATPSVSCASDSRSCGNTAATGRTIATRAAVARVSATGEWSAALSTSAESVDATDAGVGSSASAAGLMARSSSKNAVFIRQTVNDDALQSRDSEGSMKNLIRNGRIVNPGDDYNPDILIEGSPIAPTTH